ncbi:MAG TPA: hypothetical protein VFB99_15110 [Vicinamibacterales bacterium]|nr:hypothetical protein [Vicinamibacterales bacterium]
MLVDSIILTARVHMFLTLEAVVVGAGALIFRRYASRAAEAL